MWKPLASAVRSLILAGLCFNLAPEAQVLPDSLWNQELGTVGVTPASRGTVPAVGGASLRQIVLSDGASGPASVAEVARQVPSAHVQTNSRGEALVYLRGSGERQLVVTLDGAPLTIPWDRRADLGLIPTGAIDRIVVASGTPSVAWGPNALGGAIDLVSRRASSEGTLGEIGLAGSLPSGGRGSGAYVARNGAWSSTLALDASATGGAAVASGATLPFSQQPDALRTNTDRRLASVFARVGWSPRPTRSVSLALFHADVARGIAPESHLDPAEESVRYWRIPDWRQSLLVLNARSDNRLWRLRGTVWGGVSAQTIEQYESASYDEIGAEQRDVDESGGARVTAEFPRAWGVIRATSYGEVSSHLQRETDEPEERFSHATGSVGLETETYGRLRFASGVALDGMAPMETGLREDAGTFGDIALHAGAIWTATESLQLRIGGGRKTRFPSMRELYGGALGRFAINPDLRPESAWLGEVGAEIERGPLASTVVLFARDVNDTIDQVTLDDGRRQRRNLDGSRALGVEASANWQAASGVRLESALTLVHNRADDGERLTERPGAMGRVGVRLARGLWRAHVAADGVGGVVSPGVDGPEDLPGAAFLMVEIGRQWLVGSSIVELSLRGDNLLDTVHVPQTGLPAPGRSARLGLRLLL